MSPLVIAIRILRFLIGLIFALASLAAIMLLAIPIGFYGMALYLEPSLPSVTEIKTQPQWMPLQIYSHDNLLIGQYGGNKMSLPIEYDEIPQEMIHALLAAEDASFFEHSGISVKGLGRAVTQLLTDDNSQTGGSTITMQVAKNYFLTPEQTFKRKLTELFLSRKIEQELTKDEIMTLYVNKIYLGEGAYGIKAAAKRYFSKSLNKLTTAEFALLAGLPKAPSDNNPVKEPEEAKIRRDWILKRMFNLGYITQNDYKASVDEPISLHLYTDEIDHEMPYIAEMARYSLEKQFGKAVMNSGWRVKLTVDSKIQDKADSIMKRRLLNYDRAHGWRGAEATVEDKKELKHFYSFANMHPAKVTKVGSRTFTAELKSGEEVTVYWSGMSWARKYYSANRVGGYPGRPSRIVTEGDIVRLTPYNNGKNWRLVQAPKIQGSLVSINPENGAIVALVGGFDYGQSKFNRGIDGMRQPGSTIKPLIYSAALEKGYRPSSVISDSPLRIGNWKPRNSDGRYYGPMTLRRALYLSRNLVSIRLLRSVGMANARNLLDQFGLNKDKLPTTLSLALGTGSASPLQMATAYAAFANGGHRVQPYVIDQIYNFDHQLIYQANPAVACAVCFNDKLNEINDEQQKKINAYLQSDIKELDVLLGKMDKNTDLENDKNGKTQSKKNSKKDKDKQKETKDIEPSINDAALLLEKKLNSLGLDANAKKDRLKVYPTLYERAEQAPRILSPSVAFEMAGILRDVIQRGTATKAKKLGRSDIGGKTGTTNNFRDAWFAGFHPTNATVVWMGFDTPSTLGRRQYGGRLALPVWMDWMSFQLKGKPTKWVTLNNKAKSEKEKQHTIDITDSRTLDSQEKSDKNKPNLPQGTTFRRQAPITLPTPFSPSTSSYGSGSSYRSLRSDIKTTNRRVINNNLQNPNNESQRSKTWQRQQSLTTKPKTVDKNLVYSPPTTSSTSKNNHYNNTQNQSVGSISITKSNQPSNTQNMEQATVHQDTNPKQVPFNVVEVNEMPPMPNN